MRAAFLAVAAIVAVPVAMDDLILCENCVTEGARILGMSDVKQLVYLATATVKGSAAMRTLGTEFAKIDRITPNFVQRVQNILVACVQHIVDRKLMQVTGVTAQLLAPGQVKYSLQWLDLTTNANDEIDI